MAVACEIELPDPLPLPVTAETAIGIDLGLIDFLVTSQGERVPAPRHLRRAERKLRRLQRALSRKQRGSARYERQKRRVGRAYERVRNARRDFLHKLSTRLVRANHAIFVEDLSVRGLARTRLAKSVNDAGWGTFITMLEYKAHWGGRTMRRVDRFFPSSKTCFHCGHRNAIALRDRRITCAGCGSQLDRDLNAARNILREGLSSR